MPNAFDQFDAPATAAPNAFDQFDSPKAAAPKETLLEHIGKWPGRIADTVRGAVTLPRDVMPSDSALRFGESGKQVDPMSPEGRQRALDFALTFAPGAEAAGTGAQIARRAFSAGKPNPGFKPPTTLTPNMEAAQIAADIGAPLPRGVVSESPVVQATTQAARNLPLVGPQIDAKIGKTIGAAGERVGDIAEGLSGGVPDRATAGANLRPSLQGVIADNNGRIDSAFSSLRHVIDPDAVSPVGKTAAALKGIMTERVAARMAKPEAGLQDIIKLANNGASFNGLQRARADVGKIIGLAESNPNPGFNVGDFKRLYAAMSGDMENTVRANARPGAATPDQAVSVLRAANGAADQLIERNKSVQKLLNIQSDERMVGSVINSAQDKTGSARVLAQLRSQMPKQDFEQIAGVALSELGHNPTTGQFSLAKFATGWDKLGDSAKGVLFSDPNHRKMLDQIAGLGRQLKDASKYENTSKTAHSAGWGAILGGVAGAASGGLSHALAALGGLGGGYVLAKALARPATTASIAKWARAAQLQASAPSPARVATVNLATQNMLSNLSGIPGFVRDELIKRFADPGQEDAGAKQQQGAVSVRPDQNRRKVGGKDQSRAPRIQPATKGGLAPQP